MSFKEPVGTTLHTKWYNARNKSSNGQGNCYDLILFEISSLKQISICYAMQAKYILLRFTTEIHHYQENFINFVRILISYINLKFFVMKIVFKQDENVWKYYMDRREFSCQIKHFPDFMRLEIIHLDFTMSLTPSVGRVGVRQCQIERS